MVKHRHKPIPFKEIVKLAYSMCREKVGAERRLPKVKKMLREVLERDGHNASLQREQLLRLRVAKEGASAD
ncbi:hypothetical protein ABIB06_000262 [Bradyrhizobium sp. LB8.2]